MVTVLGMWEDVWMESERTERRLWRQTLSAYGVQVWGMVPVNGGPFTMPVQFPDMAAMLAAHPGPKVFLIPPGRVEGSLDLVDYVHPDDAIYVFGNTEESLVGFVTEADDVVSIFTPFGSDMFPDAALAVVLYDRARKLV